MAKIMLVEDDNNLREIYEARLLAEGYEIVAARDGEEALALAVKEKPDLIISDVMMPKISGFDMLDILRSTPETKDTKVIMMTALSQAEDKARADKLGADRYLVKSQVTLEDVAKVARDVLSGEDSAPLPAVVAAATESVAPAPVSQPTPSPAPDPIPAPTPDPVPTPDPATPEPISASATPAPTPIIPTAINDDLSQTTAAEEAAIESQINQIFATESPDTPVPGNTSTDSSASATSIPVTGPAEEPAPQPEEFMEPAPAPEPTPVSDTTPTLDPSVSPHKRVIEPINDVTKSPDLNELLKKETAMDAIKAQLPDVNTPGATPIDVTTPPDAETPTPDRPAGSSVSPGDIAL